MKAATIEAACEILMRSPSVSSKSSVSSSLDQSAAASAPPTLERFFGNEQSGQRGTEPTHHHSVPGDRLWPFMKASTAITIKWKCANRDYACSRHGLSDRMPTSAIQILIGENNPTRGELATVCASDFHENAVQSRRAKRCSAWNERALDASCPFGNPTARRPRMSLKRANHGVKK